MRFSIKLFAICLLSAVYIVCITGCADTSPIKTTSTPQHLYVGNDNASGQIFQYTLPITSTSTPVVTVTSSNVVAVAVDSNGNLGVGDNAGHLSFFSAPLTNASTPSATFNNGTATNDGQTAFDSAGDLFASNVSTKVNVFTHPVSSASTPSQAITDASLVSTIGAAFDSAGNLYVSNAGTGGGTGSTLLVYASPYSGAPIITPNVATTAYRKIALTSTQLFVASVAGSTGRVDVYNLPITASSAPAFAITNVNTPEGLATDSSGNLYVGNLSDATIRVFTPPFSATSPPTTTLTVSSGAFAIFGIAIGE